MHVQHSSPRGHLLATSSCRFQVSGLLSLRKIGGSKKERSSADLVVQLNRCCAELKMRFIGPLSLPGRWTWAREGRPLGCLGTSPRRCARQTGIARTCAEKQIKKQGSTRERGCRNTRETHSIVFSSIPGSQRSQKMVENQYTDPWPSGGELARRNLDWRESHKSNFCWSPQNE